MKLFRIIAHGMILLAVVILVIAIIFFKTKSPREQSLFFYELQKQVPAGSLEELWLLDKAIELDSTNALAYREKSISYTRNGLFEEGMKCINAAVRYDPVNQLGYRGHIKLFSIGDYEGAIQDFRHLDSLTPNFRDAPWGNDIYYVMGLAYQGLGDFKTAYDYLDKSVIETSLERSEEWVNVEIFFYRGIMSWKLNKKEEALEDFERAIGYYDKFSEAHYYKAMILKELGRLDEAIESIKCAQKYFSMGYREIHPFYRLPYQLHEESIEELVDELMMISIE